MLRLVHRFASRTYSTYTVPTSFQGPVSGDCSVPSVRESCRSPAHWNPFQSHRFLRMLCIAVVGLHHSSSLCAISSRWSRRGHSRTSFSATGASVVAVQRFVGAGKLQHEPKNPPYGTRRRRRIVEIAVKRDVRCGGRRRCRYPALPVAPGGAIHPLERPWLTTGKTWLATVNETSHSDITTSVSY